MIAGRRPAALTGIALALLVGIAGLAKPAVAANAPTLTVDSATVTASWKQGWLQSGAGIHIAGSVSVPATLRVVLRPAERSGVVTALQTYEVAQAGSFTETLPLPPRPLPGPYTLRVSGTSDAGPLSK